MLQNNLLFFFGWKYSCIRSNMCILHYIPVGGFSVEIMLLYIVSLYHSVPMTCVCCFMHMDVIWIWIWQTEFEPQYRTLKRPQDITKPKCYKLCRFGSIYNVQVELNNLLSAGSKQVFIMCIRNKLVKLRGWGFQCVCFYFASSSIHIENNKFRFNFI